MKTKLGLGFIFGALIFCLADTALASDTLFDVDSNTVALWHFNEDSGQTVSDSSPYHNDGTAIGSTIVDGEFGRARSFYSGNRDYIGFSKNKTLSFNKNDPFTIEAWIYPKNIEGDGPDGYGYNVLGTNWDTGVAISLRIINSKLQFEAIGTPGNNNYVESNVTVNSDEWLYVVGVRDPSNSELKLYINGKLAGSAVLHPDALITTTNWSIGALNGSINDQHGFFNGLIDEVRISNTARSESEIKANYDRAIGGAKSPVVIIPGILGSWNIDGAWVMDPISHSYDDLIGAFKNSGYTEGKDLFMFPYDWKKDNSFTAGLLKQKIDSIKQICNCGSVDIVAHSMGGLVARSYIQSTDYQNDVGKIVFLGTPHNGSVEAYDVWEGGTFRPNGLQSRLEETLLKLIVSAGGYKSIFDYVRAMVPSVSQILPTYDYLSENGQMRTYPQNYPVNTFLENLNSTAASLAQKVKVFNILGDDGNNKTATAVNIASDSSKLPLWENGFPVGYILGGGDGMVSVSDEDIPGVQSEIVNSAHQYLPTKAWPEISEAIMGQKGSSLEPVADRISILVVAVHSPVDIEVVDPNGNKIGKDFSAQTEINNIPDAFYTGFSDPNLEFVLIPNPVPGKYQVLTQGTGSGQYEIETNYITADNTQSDDFTADTSPLKLESLDVNLDSGVKIVPQDINPPETSSTLSGAVGKNGWFIGDVSVSLIATDTDSGIFKTEYSLNNGNSWNKYDSPFVLGEGKNTILFRSEDFMGNQEDVRSIAVNVDKTPPEAKISFDLATQKLSVKGTDNLSKTNVTEKNRQFIISDESGRSLTLNFSELDMDKKEIDASLKSLKYDQGPLVNLPKNYLKYEWSLDRDKKIKELNQKIDIARQPIVEAKYEKGVTKIGRQVKQGLVILQLLTKSGTIKVNE